MKLLKVKLSFENKLERNFEKRLSVTKLLLVCLLGLFSLKKTKCFWYVLIPI